MQLLTKAVKANHNLFLFGDLHDGSVLSSQKGWQQLLNMMNSEYKGCSNNYGIDMGDMFEAIMVDDPRFSEEKLTEPLPLAQMKRTIELRRPIQDKLITILMGNHERCFDGRTEILSETGWKLFKDLKVGERVLTFNLQTRATKYEPVLEKQVYLHDGDMYRCENRGVSMLVTPEHNLVFKTSQYSTPQKIMARDVGFSQPMRLMLAGNIQSSGVDLTQGEITVSAWYITDGHKGRYNSCGFTQRKSNAGRIKSLLSAIGWPYKAYTRQRNITQICGEQLKKLPEPEVRIMISGEAGKRLQGLVPDKHHLPEWVYRLSTSQFQLFLQAYMKGDGSICNKTIYGTKEILDELQIACLLHGVKATLNEYRPGDWRLYTRYHANQRGYWMSFANGLNLRKVPYRGMVYSASTPSGTLFVRRDGKPVLTSNSLWRFGNLTKEVCDNLDVPYGTYTAKVTIQGRNNRLMYKLFVTHGSKTIRSYADDPKRRYANEKLTLKRQLKFKAGDCAVMVKGHAHKLLVCEPETELYLTDDGKAIQQGYTSWGQREPYIHPDARWYGCSGSFLRLYLPGMSGYAEIGEYDPMELGFLVLRVRDRQIQALEPVRLNL